MANDANDDALNNKWFVLIVTLILGIILFSFMARVISKTTYKSANPRSPLQTQTKAASPVSTFTDGTDWKVLDAIKMPDTARMALKIELVKIALDSSILCGKPLLTAKTPIYEYAKDLNAFYQDPGNESMPLFFALKIIDMQKNGAAAASISGYKAMLKQKLVKMGIIKE